MWVRPVSETWPPELKRQTLREVDGNIAALGTCIERMRPLKNDSPDEAFIAAEELLRKTLHDICNEATGRPLPKFAREGISLLPPRLAGERVLVPLIFLYLPELQGLLSGLQIERQMLVKALRRDAVDGLGLHPRIASASARLYIDGHCSAAVLDASLGLTQYVKERSGCRDRDGADLMRYVFSKNNPMLAFNTLADETDRSEQEGMMHLFEGVMLALRNPRAHTLSDDSPEQALAYIALLSLLAKRLETAVRVRDP